MKAVVFAMVTLLVGSASAAESVYVTTELTRNGETVDSFSGLIVSGVKRPHRNIELRKFRDSGSQNKVKLADLELGTTSSITPVITGAGIELSYDVNYVRLMQMDTARMGNLVIDQPRTEGFKHSSSVLLFDGEKKQYRSIEDGVEYVYTLSATKR